MAEPLTAALGRARQRLAGAPRERLGELVEPRGILSLVRQPRVVPRGNAWHLGVLLLTDDAVLTTGQIVRARRLVRRGYTAQSQERRAELAGAAQRGGFAEGEIVHLGWSVIDVAAVERGGASGAMASRSGIPHVQWSRTGGWMPVQRYLDERVDLLLDPPERA